MRYKVVLEDQIAGAPVEGTSSWIAKKMPSAGVILVLDAREKMTGGVFLSEAQLYKILAEIDALEKSEKSY